MKQFFIAFLGSLAGIWLSVFIVIIGFVLILGGVGYAMLSGNEAVEISHNSYITLKLIGEITDRPGVIDPISFVRGEDNRTQGVNEIVTAIDAAADDECIDGIVIECCGSEMGLANRQTIVQALQRFKSAAPEKWIYSYGDIYTQGDYYIAAASDSIYINPIGQVLIHGLSATGLYFKNMFDKLGVDVQVVKVGTYKSAVEPYTLSGISEPAKEQQQLFLGNMWNSVASDIASMRNVSQQEVNSWADESLYGSPVSIYCQRGIIDRTMYRHEFESMLADITGKDCVKELTPVTPAEFCRVREVGKSGDRRDATIAVLYACGEITDEAGDGIVASKIIPEIFRLSEDDGIDGLVLYVNSGGGSAFASEQIWEALEQWKTITGKPFYVSMSDYAASGGYYISCGADRIYAQPCTLTGSIGIFGLIPDVSGLLNDKIGVTTSTVATNPDGALPGILQPLSPTQKQVMQGYVNRGYELFVSRCATGRNLSVESVKAIAEGRVWDGAEALKLGLVDKLGGIDKAIADMAESLLASSWTVRQYPVQKERWYDILFDAGVDIKSHIVKSELGDMASFYYNVKHISDMSNIQARMEFMKVDM